MCLTGALAWRVRRQGLAAGHLPDGKPEPYRIDLFDDEVDSIRTFDPETQRSQEKITRIRMLPAREFPLNEDGITRFRRNYRSQFEGDLQRSLIYQDVSEGRAPNGLEYYLPLFYEETATLFSYLPENRLIIHFEGIRENADEFYRQVEARYEERRYDLERPLLPPREIYLPVDELFAQLKQGISVAFSAMRSPNAPKVLPGISISTPACRPLWHFKPAPSVLLRRCRIS